MEASLIRDIAVLRSVIGYLGERNQFAWWQSSFFAPSSSAFLVPAFPRTAVLAQAVAVTEAAARIHDERIGAGRVHHLFRLPEDVEQALHRALQDGELSQHIQSVCASKQSALDYLRMIASPDAPAAIGPTLVGHVRSVRTSSPWSSVAALYLHAFGDGHLTFPYFNDKG